MKKPDNPFVLNTYHGKAYFCDREDDLLVLQEHIKNGRNVVLYAWRRLGKSALVQRCLRSTRKGFSGHRQSRTASKPTFKRVY
ncbi:hypothetical protein [Belliella baltica]|uniref:hypothetical protein n=1 Tax=Belliella baltica TaxID=232259 RepID=UPI00031F80C1|nr:hypothetical protein [Belliella baltica]